MRSVVVDANVFVSFFVERNAAQHSAARALLSAAEDGEIAGIIPQSVIFEIAYVLQSQYGLTGSGWRPQSAPSSPSRACGSSMTARGNACWKSGPKPSLASLMRRSSPSPPRTDTKR